MIKTIFALLTTVTVAFVTGHARPFPCNRPPLTPPSCSFMEPSPQQFFSLEPSLQDSLKTRFFPEVRPLLSPQVPHQSPPPDQDTPSLETPLFFPEMRSPQSPSVPNHSLSPDQDTPSLQTPFFFPETRSSLSPSVANRCPPPDQDTPSLQTPFFFPETRSPPPPFFYTTTMSPLPPYLEMGNSPPASWSMLIQKLIIAAGILAAILVLLLVLSKCRGLTPETIVQAIGLSVAVTTCLSA